MLDHRSLVGVEGVARFRHLFVEGVQRDLAGLEHPGFFAGPFAEGGFQRLDLRALLGEPRPLLFQLAVFDLCLFDPLRKLSVLTAQELDVLPAQIEGLLVLVEFGFLDAEIGL
ncbi:MAG: hypothetical protein AAFU79_24960, partial [Myxococcota bacterium]